MKKRLFLTGPMGCGKSTAIANALGENITRCGGFLTRRYREPNLHFVLESPDGRQKATFLEFAEGIPRLNTEVFDSLGVEFLKGEFLLLDEIGGIELLCPAFMAALEAALKRDIPIIGVMKGEGSASALIQTLALTERYESAAARLRTWLQNDADTLLYECGQFDEHALYLAENWVKEYCP